MFAESVKTYHTSVHNWFHPHPPVIIFYCTHKDYLISVWKCDVFVKRHGWIYDHKIYINDCKDAIQLEMINNIIGLCNMCTL